MEFGNHGIKDKFRHIGNTLLRYFKPVSKAQMMLEDKARGVGKAERIRKYVSILQQLATQSSDLRGAFEIGFRFRL